MDLQITSSTISKSGQLAVPAMLKRHLNLKNNDRVIWNIDPINKIATLKASPRDWGTYLSGLGSDVWKDVDVEKYIKDLRQDRTF